MHKLKHVRHIQGLTVFFSH